MTLQQAIELAVQHQAAGRLGEAERICRNILQQRPDEPSALQLLGCVALRAGNLPAAEELMRRAMHVAPNVPEIHNNLAVVLQSAGKMDEAGAQFRAALELKPDYVAALHNLSAWLSERGELTASAEMARKACERAPAQGNGFNNLGNTLMRQGDAAGAIAAYRKAVELDPANAQVHSNLLLTLHYLPESDPAAMFEEHRRFAQRFPPPPPRKYPHRRDAKRRLRIGYVSSDFRQHSVGYFIEAAIEKHDRGAFEVVCYSDVAKPDEMTNRMRARANSWRPIAGASHDAVAELIRRDQIDILVDLGGHTAHNRLPVFAQKLAPVQVSYLGYPDTTGLAAMDYRITDSRVDPPGEADQFSVEKLHRLDPCAWCFRPHEPYPPVASSPPTDRPITFGTFNALAKSNEPLIATWAEILRAVPESRFFMKAGAFVDTPTADRLRRQFESHGVAPDRVELVGQRPNATQHLSMYERMDIALDTFPYNGTTTTCEAMWMGVPVVALAGRTHAGRVGVSLLGSVRLEELIAPNREDYVRLAVEMAQDRARLSNLRQGLRQRMLASPLMNGVDFVRRLEAAYRSMWGHWCARGGRPV